MAVCETQVQSDSSIEKIEIGETKMELVVTKRKKRSRKGDCDDQDKDGFEGESAIKKGKNSSDDQEGKKKKKRGTKEEDKIVESSNRKSKKTKVIKISSPEAPTRPRKKDKKGKKENH